MADVTILQLPTLSPAAITGADVLPIVDVSDLTDPGGTTKGVAVNALPYNLQTQYDIRRYGAISPGVGSTNAAAVMAAMTAANAAGGGVVVAPNLPYNIDGSVITFDGMSHVLLVGSAPAFNYTAANAVTTFTITTGVWGIRIPPTSSYCGTINISLTSNGVLNGTVPHVVTTAGVEYGFLIETGVTLHQNCTAAGFQYGCVLSNGGNSNLFENCTFVLNTKVGFACTTSSSAAYAAYHPNLTPPASFVSNTVWTMYNCRFRRNGWGQILRQGNPMYTGVNVVESNYFGGTLLGVGALDSGVGLTAYTMYHENNWSDYDATASYTITQNNLLQDASGTWLPWTSGVTTASNSAGYQIYSMGGAAQTGTTAGPGYVHFYEPTIVCGSAGATPAKAIYLQQSYQWKFYNGSCSGGDQPNAVRLSASTYFANITHFWDWSGTLPTPLGNRGAQFTTEASAAAGGGMTATQGFFRNVAGTVTGTTGTFSGTLGVTGITSLTGVNTVAGSGAALVGTAGLRLSDTNSGGSRDWVIADGASATGVSQVGALTFSESTAASGDPLAAGVERMRLTASGLGVANGFGCNGVGAIAKPTVTGSKGANAALASLLTALASYGLITDSST